MLDLAPFYAAQGLALAAAVIELVAYRKFDKRRLFFALVVSNLLVGTHFLLLGKAIAAITVYMASLRFLLAPRLRWRALPWLFFSAPVVSTLLLYDEPMDVLPLLAGYFLVFGTYKHDDALVRRNFLIGNGLWLIYDVYAQALVMAVVELFAMIGNALFLLKRRSCRRRR